MNINMVKEIIEKLGELVQEKTNLGFYAEAAILRERIIIYQEWIEGDCRGENPVIPEDLALVGIAAGTDLPQDEEKSSPEESFVHDEEEEPTDQSEIMEPDEPILPEVSESLLSEAILEEAIDDSLEVEEKSESQSVLSEHEPDNSDMTPRQEEQAKSKPEVVEEPSDEIEKEFSEPESLELRELRKSLQAANQRFIEGNYGETIALCQWLLRQAQSLTDLSAFDLIQQLEDLERRATKERDNLVGKEIQAARRNIDDGDFESAKLHIFKARELDPENSSVQGLLLELDRQHAKQNAGNEIRALRLGLSERSSLQTLEDAVRKGEAMEFEGSLPPELIDVLHQARKAFNQKRDEHGQITSQVAQGDLRQKKEAWDEIQKAVARGEKDYFDQRVTRIIPIEEMLQSAEKAWADESESYAERVIQKAMGFLPKNPQYAYDMIQKEIQEQPFALDHKRKLEEQLSKYKEQMEARAAALRLVEQSHKEQDPVKILKIRLNARSQFRDLDTIDYLVEQATETALKSIVARVDDKLRQAKIRFSAADEKAGKSSASLFTEVEQFLSAATELLTSWPGELEKPELITKKEKECAELANLTLSRKTDHIELDSQMEVVRRLLADPNQRAVAREKFNQLFSDPRFTGNKGLVELRDEVEQYADINEKIAIAQVERASKQWEHVFRLCNEMKQAGNLGALAPAVEELLQEAILEIDIERIHMHIANDDVRAANIILQRITRDLPSDTPSQKSAKSELQIRLREPIAAIQEAIAADKAIGGIYQDALAQVDLAGEGKLTLYLEPISCFENETYPGNIRQTFKVDWEDIQNKAQQRKIKLDSLLDVSRFAGMLLCEKLKYKLPNVRLSALRVFRFIGCEKIDDPDPAWGEQKISLRTNRARRLAQLLSDSLRSDLYLPIREAWEKKQIQPSKLTEITNACSILRTAGLLQTEEQKSILRWAEVTIISKKASEKEVSGLWDESVAIWQDLLRLYPGEPIGDEGLRNAQIKQAGIKAKDLVQQGRPEDAITLVMDLLSSGKVGRPIELLFVLVECHIANHDYIGAKSFLDEAAHDPSMSGHVEKMKILIRNSQIVYQTLTKAQEEMGEAERILNQPQSDGSHYIEWSRGMRSLLSSLFLPDVERESPELCQEIRSWRELGISNFQKETEKIVHKKIESHQAAEMVLATRVALELQALETKIDLPENLRKSPALIQMLAPSLAMTADVVHKESKEKATPFRVCLAKDIPEITLLISNLAVLDNLLEKKIYAPNQGSTRSELKLTSKRLQTLLDELTNVLKTLEKLTQPKEKGGDRWLDAIGQNELDSLKPNQEFNFGYPIDELENHKLKLEEWQEVYYDLKQLMYQIRTKYLSEEKFNEVVNLINTHTTRPPERKNHQEWKVLSTKDYEKIWEQMGQDFKIPEALGSPPATLIGWERIRETAIFRQREVEEYAAWRQQYEVVHGSAVALYISDGVKKNLSTMTLFQQRQRYLDLKLRLEACIKMYNERPDIQVRCKQVETIVSESQRVHTEEVLVHKAFVDAEIERIDRLIDAEPMPNGKDLLDAFREKNWQKLQALVETIERVGVGDLSDKGQTELFRIARKYREIMEKQGHWK